MSLSTPPAPPTSSPASPTRRIRVALIGNPNTGKSTLFGALSGLAVRTGNYPGVTVEKRTCVVHWDPLDVELVDLPGTYGLAPRSPDEMVAVDVLTDHQQNEPIDVTICVASALLLERSLFLVSQLLELNKPLVLAINMTDVAEARGRKIDAQLLSQRLGVPVVLTAAARRTGLDTLKAAVVMAARGAVTTTTQPTSVSGVAPPPTGALATRAMPDAFYTIVDQFYREVCERTPHQASEKYDRYVFERALLDIGGYAETRLLRAYGASARQTIMNYRQRLEEACGPIAELETSARYAWSSDRLEGVILGNSANSVWTDRIDAVLTGRWTGLLAFAFLMVLIFQIVFTLSAWPMDRFEEIQGYVSGLVQARMSPGIFRSLVVDGVIAGVGGVLIFVPQIALLFFVIAVLEDCGYMARAAFLSDRLMSLLGLSGKSFLPLISSFGCAVPGIMATRVIENRRDRFVTIMVAPLMSCSARLPVYMLMITAFVPELLIGGWLNLRATVLLGMYAVGALLAIPTAWLLRQTVLAGETAPFVLELPEYKLPSAKVVLFRVWEAVREFVIRAGTLIFAASILIWAAGYLPGNHQREFELEAQLAAVEASDSPSKETELAVLQSELQKEQSRLIEASFLGWTGHTIEPVVRPLGWDWKIGVGALASFPAREVIISTLGTIYSLGGDVDSPEGETSLKDQLRAARWPDGRPVYTIAVALSVMVFFALCAQCVSTLLVIRRETNSWRWPTFSFFYMTTLAYLGAMLTYQIASRLGL